MGLCWRICPAAESHCEFLTFCVDLLCPCGRRKRSPSEESSGGLYSSTTSIRRISRINSDDSLEDVLDRAPADYPEDPASRSPSPPPSGHGKRFHKKNILRKFGTKAIKKSYSVGALGPSDEGSLDERDDTSTSSSKKRLRRLLQKSHTAPEEGSSRTDEELSHTSTNLELKPKFPTMLKESRKTHKESKTKQFLSHLSLRSKGSSGGETPEEAGISGYQKSQKCYGSHHHLGKSIDEEQKEFYGATFEEKLESETRSLYELQMPYSANGMKPILMLPPLDGVEDPNQAYDYDYDRGEGDGSPMDVGSQDNPMRECFGSITLAMKCITSKIVSVNILSLQGIPCRQGKDTGLCLELTAFPHGKSVWLPLPLAHGSRVTVNSDVSMKIPTLSSKPSFFGSRDEPFIRICVWQTGRTWKHCEIGNALLPLSGATPVPSPVGLYRHSQLPPNAVGMLQVGLSSSVDSSSRNSVKKSATSKVALAIEVIKAQFSKTFTLGKGHSAIRQFKRAKRDIWCRISLWSKGSRVEKICTPKVHLPTTNDPQFGNTLTFVVPRPNLPFSSLVIKIMCDRGLGEDVIGKLVLGPHMYLGVERGSSPPTALSQWGRALTHPGQINEPYQKLLRLKYCLHVD